MIPVSNVKYDRTSYHLYPFPHTHVRVARVVRQIGSIIIFELHVRRHLYLTSEPIQFRTSHINNSRAEIKCCFEVLLAGVCVCVRVVVRQSLLDSMGMGNTAKQFTETG